MRRTIKYIGFFNSSTKYNKREWDTKDIQRIMFNNDLRTKKGIIKYLSGLKIHEDSIKNFMELLKETKKEIKEEKNKELKLINKTKKIVEKYLK